MLYLNKAIETMNWSWLGREDRKGIPDFRITPAGAKTWWCERIQHVYRSANSSKWLKRRMPAVNSER